MEPKKDDNALIRPRTPLSCSVLLPPPPLLWHRNISFKDIFHTQKRTMSVTFANHDFGKCVGFDTYTDTWSGHCDDYWKSLSGSTAALGAAVFILSILLLLVYICVRLCGLVCCIAKGCRPSVDGASAGCVKFHRVCIFVTIVCTTAALAVAGTVYRSDLTDAVHHTVEKISDTRYNVMGLSDTIETTTRNLYHDFPKMAGTAQVTRLLQNVTSANHGVHKWTDNVHVLEDSLRAYLWLIDFGLWAAFGFTVLFFVCTLMNCHWVIPVIAFFMLIIWTLLLSVSQVTVAFGAAFVKDGCDDFPAVNQTLDNFFHSERYLHNDNIEGISSAQGNVEDIYFKFQCQDAKSDLQELCTKYFDCTSKCTDYASVATYIVAAKLKAGVAAGTCTDPTHGCNIPKCATGCPAGSPQKTLSAHVMALQSATQNAAKVIGEKAAPLQTSTVWMTGFDNLREPVCNEKNSVTDKFPNVVRIVSGMCVIMFLASFAAALGSYVYNGRREVKDEGQPLVYVADYQNVPRYDASASAYHPHANYADPVNVKSVS